MYANGVISFNAKYRILNRLAPPCQRHGGASTFHIDLLLCLLPNEITESSYFAHPNVARTACSQPAICFTRSSSDIDGVNSRSIAQLESTSSLFFQ